MINARIKLDDYTNRVLNVFKAKYDLKDKSEAINKFIRTYSYELAKPEVSDDYILKFDKKVKKYLKNNPKLEGISKNEFNELFKV